MFREGFGRHHRDFPALGLFSKAYFPSVLFTHFLHFLLRAQLKIPDRVPEAEGLAVDLLSVRDLRHDQRLLRLYFSM